MEIHAQTQRDGSEAFAAHRQDDDPQAATRMENEGGPPALSDDSPRAAPPRRHTYAPTATIVGRTSLTVGEVMTTHVSAAWQDSTVKELALIMAGEAIGGVPVVDPDNRLVGLVTYRDIVIRACAGDKSLDELRAGDAMTIAPAAISPRESLSQALEKMATLQVHRLPVLDDSSHLVGMISIGDIATRADSSTTVALRDALARISDRRSFWTRV